MSITYNNREAIDELIERATRVQWLQPDSEMDLQSPAALGFIRDRLDEHIASLERFSSDGPLPLEPSITHSMYDTYFLSGQRLNDPGKTHFAPLARRWLEHLDFARREVLTATLELDPHVVAFIANRMWAAFRQSNAATPKVQRELNDYQKKLYEKILAAKEYVRPIPGGESWLLEALRLATNVSLASPWSPLFALWERGLGTLPSFDGKLLLYLPVRINGTIAAEPTPDAPFSPFDDYAPETSNPVLRAKRRNEWSLFQGGSRLSVYDRDPAKAKPGGALSWWATVKRFARSGLGPVPGMTREFVDNSRDLAVSNSPFVRPSLWITPLPEQDWSPEEALDWISSKDEDAALMRRSTFPDV